MASLNKVQLIGNLGKDPEIRMTPQGAKVATFSIATTERYTDRNGQKQENTEWHNIVAWRGLADIIERYLRKGSAIYIEGKLTTRSWDDPQSGQKKYRTEIVAREMQMLGSRSEAGQGDTSYSSSGYDQSMPSQESQSSISDPFDAGPDDDLPF
jgi:single-strand DNA-binding protein